MIGVMNVADFFSGIGGFSVGFERAGFRTVLFCESDPSCRARLERHWPGVPCVPNIRGFRAYPGLADVYTVGFPCQFTSTAARGRNNAEDLWPEGIRVIREGRPDWVVAENVPGIGLKGVDRVCRDLEDEGYTVWPFDIDTALPTRQRGRHRFIWLAHADRDCEPRLAVDAEMACLRPLSGRDEANDPAPVGMDDGICCRMDRLHMLGNAVTPTIAELIARAIVRATNS